MTYYCSKCEGDSTLEERILHGTRLGAVVCKDCRAVYPSYLIDNDTRAKMAAAKGNSKKLRKLSKDNKKLMKKHKKMFQDAFGGKVIF